jgi:glutamine amidotransferase-like uncharacterized protein
MHGRRKLFALLLCLVLVPCYGHAADLANDQQALVQSLVQSTAAADRQGAQTRLALFDVDAQEGATGNQRQAQLKEILETESKIACQIVSAVDVQQGILKQFDVVLFPGGYAPDQYSRLDESGRAAVKQFVRDGGGYVGICAGAFLASAKYGAGLELINVRPLGQLDADGKMIPRTGPGGWGKVNIDLSDAGKNLFGGPVGEFEANFSGGPTFCAAGAELPDCVALATIRSQPSDYDAQLGEMVGTPAIVAGRYGQGRVIIFSPHFEFTEGRESLVRRGVVAVRRISPDQ